MSQIDDLQISQGNGDESAFGDNAGPEDELSPLATKAPARARAARSKTNRSTTAAPADAAKARATGTRAATGAGVTKAPAAAAKKGRPKTKAAVKKPTAKRKALADISNAGKEGAAGAGKKGAGKAKDTAGERDDFDELNDGGGGAHADDDDEMQVDAEHGDAHGATADEGGDGAGKEKRARGRRAAAKEIPETQQEPERPARKAGRPAKREVVPETQAQPDAMDVDESAAPDADDTLAGNITGVEERLKAGGAVGAANSRRRRSVPHGGGGAPAANENTEDAALRQKLGAATRKLEALQAQYQDLRDVAVGEAESNFERLRKQSGEKSKAAEELISSLRAEIAAQNAAAADAASLREQISALTAQNERVAAEKRALAKSLAEAQGEAKTLHAKLAATRSTSNPAQSGEAAAAAAGSRAGGGPRTVLVSSAEAAKEAQKRMLKEDIYSDLTGLVLLDVRRREEEGEDVYDCIQTGRNGTLHFHLTVANPAPSTNSKAAGGGAAPAPSYEDAEFQYTPLLDEKRDRELLDMLPDYLTEEICFPRSNASKFYARVADCMTKKVELVEE